MVRRFWQHMSEVLRRPGRRRVALIGSIGLLAGLLEAAILVLVVNVGLAIASGASELSLDTPLTGAVTLSTAAALTVASAAGVITLALHILMAHEASTLAASVLEQTRSRALRGFANATWERQEDEREGALQETVSTLALRSSNLANVFANFLTASAGVIALLAAAFLVNPGATVGVVLFGGLLVVGVRPIGRATQRRSQRFVHENAFFMEQIAQWSSLALEHRIFGVQATETARLIGSNHKASAAMRAMQFASRTGASFYRDAAILFMIGALVALNSVSASQLESIGAVVLLVARSIGYASAVNAAIQQINEHSPNLELLLTRVRNLENQRDAHGGARVPTVLPLRLDSVSYEYTPGQPALAGVSLDIMPGEMLGVIGPSGGGKSTLVQLLLRLRGPSHGQIVAADIRYEEIDDEVWQRLVAAVPQEPKLFQGSIRDNIAFHRTGLGSEQIADAAAAAHILDEVLAMDGGFDRVLGPRGAGLSGGQRQRIAIARALVGKPELLVMDEPTSALDRRTEELLQQTLVELRGSTTVILVAHRLTTLTLCDRVIALKDGKVATIGSLEEASAAVKLPIA